MEIKIGYLYSYTLNPIPTTFFVTSYRFLWIIQSSDRSWTQWRVMTMTLRSRGLRCIRGDTVVTADRRWVRRVVTGGSVVTGHRRRVRWLVTVDVMVMGDALVTGDAMVTGTGEHGCRSGHT